MKLPHQIWQYNNIQQQKSYIFKILLMLGLEIWNYFNLFQLLDFCTMAVSDGVMVVFVVKTDQNKTISDQNWTKLSLSKYLVLHFINHNVFAAWILRILALCRLQCSELCSGVKKLTKITKFLPNIPILCNYCKIIRFADGGRLQDQPGTSSSRG